MVGANPHDQPLIDCEKSLFLKTLLSLYQLLPIFIFDKSCSQYLQEEDKIDPVPCSNIGDASFNNSHIYD